MRLNENRYLATTRQLNRSVDRILWPWHRSHWMKLIALLLLVIVGQAGAGAISHNYVIAASAAPVTDSKVQ
jgi:hypothetical protein